jgi:hypothetical protein
MDDFLEAMTKVAPSTQREARIQVQRVSWDDIGGLEEVKLVSNLVLIFCFYCCLISLSTETSTISGMAHQAQGIFQKTWIKATQRCLTLWTTRL